MINSGSPSAAATPALLPLAEQVCAVAKRVRDELAWRERVAPHVLDWLGTAAYGAASAVGQPMAQWLALQAAGAVPTLAGRAADAAAAATYHGMLGSVLEMDDVHRSSVLHPAPVVVPAAWAACAETTDAATLLAAVTAGYEAMIRVGRTLGATHYRFWHPTATVGAFGAAAAAAVGLGLEPQRVAQAMALAGTQAGGLWQVRHESGTGKLWHMASAARAGLAAAQAAACGLTGPLAVLEGPSGWLAATAPDADLALLNAPRDTPWIDDVSFKPWPACRHAHPAMDALRHLLQAQPVAPAEVARLDVFGYADARRFCERRHPHTASEARFSIPHALAAWLNCGWPQLEHYEDDALADPRIQALRERVVLHDDAEFQARYPTHYGARIELTCHDGRRLFAEVRDTLGDPAVPLDRSALEAKALELMQAAGWSPRRRDEALIACCSLPTTNRLDALRALIGAAQ